MGDNSCIDITSSTQDDHSKFGENWATISMHYLMNNCLTEFDINRGGTDFKVDQDISAQSSTSSTENVLVSPNDVLSIDRYQYPNFMLDIINNEDVLEIEQNQAEQTIPTTHIINGLSSLPASEDWPGTYNFNIHLNSSGERKKGIMWKYVSSCDTLYVRRSTSCPISFATSCHLPTGVKIRATALYSSPDSATEVVERCLNHTNDDRNLNVLHPEHLVRCESPLAEYEVEPITRRYSVVVPYENPPVGQSYSTYIFKFTCFGSCPGQGRRPLMLVFSLEKNGQVIGRRKVGLKICACPLRDSQVNSSENGRKSKKRKMKKEQDDSLPSLDVKPKRIKLQENESESYTIKVKDRKCFEFLSQMKIYFEMLNTMKNMPPDVKKIFKDYNKRKGFNISLD